MTRREHLLADLQRLAERANEDWPQLAAVLWSVGGAAHMDRLAGWHTFAHAEAREGLARAADVRRIDGGLPEEPR